MKKLTLLASLYLGVFSLSSSAEQRNNHFDFHLPDPSSFHQSPQRENSIIHDRRVKQFGNTTFIDDSNGRTTIKRRGNNTYIDSPKGITVIKQRGNNTYIHGPEGISVIKQRGNKTYIQGNTDIDLPLIPLP